jgi:hypothetical protein
VPPDRHQELVLRRGEPDRRRMLLTPPEEASHRNAKVQEMPEILLGRLNGPPSSAETSEIHRNPTNLPGGRVGTRQPRRGGFGITQLRDSGTENP